MLADELRQLTKRVTNRENKKTIAEALEYLETLKEPWKTEKIYLLVQFKKN